MSEICGLCGSTDIFSGSWSPSRCRDCGATESVMDWYIDESAQPTLAELKAAKDRRINNE